MDEVKGIEDLSLVDGVVLYMFDNDTFMPQWEEFINDPSADIFEFPKLAWELLVYGFGGVTSIRVEGDHRTVKIEALKSGGPIKPATVAVRLRRSYLHSLLERQAFRNFLIVNWRRKGMWARLLEHRFPAKSVNAMSLAQKCSHVYTFAIEDQFDADCDMHVHEPSRASADNKSRVRTQVEAWSSVAAKFVAKPVKVEPVEKLLI